MINVHSFLLITYIYLSHSTFSQAFFVKVHGGDPSRSSNATVALKNVVLLELVKLAFQIDSNWLSKLFAARHVLPIIVQFHFHLKFLCFISENLLFFFKCKPTVAAACLKGSPILPGSTTQPF